ncbi:MAG: hypothetical protein ACFFBP_06890 [Promethearchaeota archaeon]
MSFILAFIMFLIGHYVSYLAGGSIDLYFQLNIFAFAFIIAGVIFIVLFHTGFADVKQLNKLIEVAIGIFVIIWILLPFNYFPAQENDFRISTYIIMSLYGMITYAHLGYSFLKIAKKSTMRRKELNIMGIGSIIFLFFFIIISAFGITQNIVFIVIGMISLYCTFICYFLGIYLPKLKSK